MTTDSAPTRDPVERLAESFLERYRRGERPSLTEYTQAHPELADDIRELFPALVELEGLKSHADDPSGRARGGARSIPWQLGDYRIIREIGRGGMGVVFEAIQQSLGRRVALKVLPPCYAQDRGFLARFRREARAAASLHHTNIVPVFGVGEDEGCHYFAMQFIRGQSLEAVLDEVRMWRAKEGRHEAAAGASLVHSRSTTELARSLMTGRFARACHGEGEGGIDLKSADIAPCEPVPEDSPVDANEPQPEGESKRDSLVGQDDAHYHRSIARVGLQVAEALDYAHSQGILHRDIKPANLLMDLSGTVWVADFGLAKPVEGDDLSKSRELVGTLRYMAPERFEGQSDRRSDIYGLGITLYELLTLRPAFDGADQPRLMRQILGGTPMAPHVLDQCIPRDLETICLKAMARDPSERYGSAAAMADDLRRFLADRTILARRSSPHERLWRWCRRNPLVATLLAAVAVLLIAFGVSSSVSANRYRRQWLRANDEWQRANRAEADALERLHAVQVQKQRAAELAARATFDRGIALCEQGEVDRGLLLLAESLRLVEEPGGVLPISPLARTIRATIADWMARSRVLLGFLNHDADLEASALSANGRLAATGSRDRTAQIWSAADGRLIATLSHSAAVHGVCFAPTGDAILTIANDTVAIWDPLSGVRRRGFTRPSPVLTAAFDPGSRRLVLAGEDGVARVFDVADGRPVGPELRHRGPILQALFLPPDGRTLLTASDDRTARLWCADNGQPVGAVIPLTESSVCAVSSPGGRSVMIGCRDGTAQLWDTATGRAIGPSLRHGAEVSAGLFLSDGRRLVTGSRDWRVRIWDVGDQGTVGEPRVLRHAAPVTSLALSEDGRNLVVGCRSGQAFVWDLASSSIVAVLPHLGIVHRVAIGGDGRTVLVSGQESSARLWRIPPRVPSGMPVAEKDILYAMTLSADGTLLATAGEEGIARLWDARTGRKRGELRHASEIRGVAFSPDGRSIVTASGDQVAILWDIGTLRPRRRFPHPERLDSVAIGPNGQRLLTGGRDGLITLWEIETGRKRCERRLHGAPVMKVSFSPDGRSFASASGDQTAVLGRVDGLEPIAPPLRHQGHVWVAAFRPDGKLLLTGGDDKTIRLWDPATGQPAGPSLDHASRIRLAVFSPDGNDVLIGSEPGKSRFWDLAAGKPVGAPLEADAWILAARFDPSTREMTTASEGVSIGRRPAPRPLEGDAEAIACRIQAMTGMRYQPGGDIELLDITAWRQIAERLTGRASEGPY